MEVEFEEERVKITIQTNQEVLSGSLQQFRNQDFPPIEWNDLVLITGTLKELSSNTVPYLFDYQEYARRHQQFYSIDIQDIKLMEKNQNPFYGFKTTLKNRMNKMRSRPYLYAFLFGDTSYISDDVMDSYRDNGVSHLLAISGMHVSFLMGVIAFLLEKWKVGEKARFVIYLSFLGFYAWLVGFSPSVLRASLFFLLLRFSKILSLDIKPILLLLFLFFLLLFVNPFYLWEVGFQYSFAISFLLVLSSSYLEEGPYFKKLLATSYLSFLPSIIIGVYHFHQIQLLSIFYNLFFVPVVSFLVFPLSFITFFIPFVEPVYLFLIQLMEKISLFLAENRDSIWIMRHPSIWGVFYLSFVVFVVYFLFLRRKKVHFLVLLVALFLYHHSSFFIPEDYMISLDVGQGDSTFLYSRGESMLIDTGGNIYKDYARNVIIPYLKAKGVLRIDTLVLTHGDFDHMGSAMNLIKNFQVGKVVFNVGEYNELETNLMEILDNQKIPYYKELKTMNMGHCKLYFLNTRIYDNENDNSSVIYVEIYGHKLLLMGDAGIEREQDILKQYDIRDIDFLKVGHHGSNTSSGLSFIHQICPKYSLISVGKNNRYGHPKKSVLDILSYSTIYRTDIDGSIEVFFRKNGYYISTYRP